MKFRLIEDSQQDYITVYHGTPYKKSAEVILKTGLNSSKATASGGGNDKQPSIAGRNYLSLKVWKAVVYSCSRKSEKEPYGYVFSFRVNKNDLLPDEDEIGYQLIQYLKGEIKLPFSKNHLNSISKDNLLKLKSYDYNADFNDEENNNIFVMASEIGRNIMNKLTADEVINIINNSDTVTTLKNNLIPIHVWKVNKNDFGETFSSAPNDVMLNKLQQIK